MDHDEHSLQWFSSACTWLQMCVYVYDLVGMSEDTLLKLDPTSNERHSNEILEGFKVVKRVRVYLYLCACDSSLCFNANVCDCEIKNKYCLFSKIYELNREICI